MNLTEREKTDLKKSFNEIIDNFKGHTEFPKVLLQMIKVHSDKSNDYATDESPFSNIELCRRANFPAWKGVVIRLGDKYSRLLNALSGKLFKCESVEDAFLDNACYSVIGLIEYREENVNKNT
jgi:hypothetical protein